VDSVRAVLCTNARDRWGAMLNVQIIDDMRRQRQFLPVLAWRCAEIRLRPANGSAGAERRS